MSDGTAPGGRTKLISVSLTGETVPAGSKNGFAVRRKDGHGIWRVVVRRDVGGHESAIVTVSDSNSKRIGPRRKEVKAQVEAAIAETDFVMPGPDVPLAVEVTIWKPRPVSHFGTGRNSGALKGSAAAFPVGKPDATKLWRALEDDLTGLLWPDDSRIVTQLVRKRYAAEHRATLTLWSLPRKVADL